MIPTNAKPVTNWPSPDRAFHDIVQQVHRVITRLESSKAGTDFDAIPDKIEQQIGNYRLVSLLGHGGFAEVYLGEHIHLGTQAAIKVLHTQLERSEIEQFRNEARTIAHLEHPHIVRILDFGVEGTTPFLVMSYAQGGSLRTRYPKGTCLPPITVASYVQQVASALQYAHDRKLIHRDVKPENLLIGRSDEIFLSDFGIALIIQNSQSQSTRDMAGTIAYMAPEQIQAHPLPASDQYSLGIVVYEWLCGDRPFHGSFNEIAIKHSTTPPPSLLERVPTLAPAVEQVVMTALAKDPKGSTQAFANALEQANKPQQPASPPDPDISISIISMGKKSHLQAPILVALLRVPIVVPLIILVIVSSIVGIGIYRNHMNQMDASVAAVTSPATSTAQANTTATVQAYPSYLSGNGTLVLVDPLNQEGEWQNQPHADGGNCQFTGGVYHVSQQETDYFTGCDSRETFSNFAFEVQMNIIKGDCGGITFRISSNGFYYFRVCENGTYEVNKYNQSNSSTTLNSTTNLAIHTGLEQQNKIAVEASGNTMTFYINEQRVDQEQDSSSTSGHIGLVGAPDNNATDVVYSNTKLWTL